MDIRSTRQLWNAKRPELDLPLRLASQVLTGSSDVTPVMQFAAADAYTAWGMQQGKVDNGAQNNYTHQFAQGLTIVHGKHEFKTGWEMRRLTTFGHDLATTNGTYVFARNETANPAATGTTGNSFASSPCLACPDSSERRSHSGTRRQHSVLQYYGFYFRDNWKVSSKSVAATRHAL